MNPIHLLTIRLLIILLKTTLSTSSIPSVWSEGSLFNCTIINHLTHPYKILINHLIFDPEKYIEDKTLTNILKSSIEPLLNNYNIKNFLFLVNSVENSFSYSKFENLIFKINDYLNTNNDDFNPDFLISTFISLKQSKIFIVRGDKVNKVISNNEVDYLIRRIENILKSKTESVHTIITNYYENILKMFRKNTKLNKNFYEKYKNLIILFVIVIIIIICVIYFSGESNDFELKISQKENKIISFLDKNNENNLEIIMEKNCLICLDSYYQKKEDPNINNRKYSSDNIKVDIGIFKLPCGHTFHNECLLKWFLKETKCPLCKSVFKLKQNQNKNDNKIKIIKYTINQNSGFSNKTKLGFLIEDFVQIQKKFNPHIISNSFGNDLIREYKINLGKDESFSNITIYSSPENLLCKVLSSAEAKNTNENTKYDKLDTSINITSRNTNREDENSSDVKL